MMKQKAGNFKSVTFENTFKEIWFWCFLLTSLTTSAAVVHNSNAGGKQLAHHTLKVKSVSFFTNFFKALLPPPVRMLFYLYYFYSDFLHRSADCRLKLHSSETIFFKIHSLVLAIISREGVRNFLLGGSDINKDF